MLSLLNDHHADLLKSTVCNRHLSAGRIAAQQTCEHKLLGAGVSGGGLLRAVAFLCANVEKSCLLRSVFAQFGHFVHAAGNSLLLFPLIPALCLVPLSLLPCVFLLALRKC